MGRIEKLVVLAVMGVIIVILAVTFTPNEIDAAGGSGEVATGERSSELEDLTGTRPQNVDRGRPRPEDLSAGAGDAPRPELVVERTPERDERAGTSPLLNTGVVLKDREPQALPAGAILISTRGLEDSALDEFKLYRALPGDTWTGLAERFYGDAAREGLLRRYNEGRDEVEAGKVMFVSVFDVPEEPEREASAAAAETYLVQEGESLWTISKVVYGAGAQWKKLHEANRDLLPDAHDLKPGMRLRVPR